MPKPATDEKFGGQATPLKRVAVLIEASRAYGRGLLEGVSRYQREQQGWSIYFRARGQDSPLPEWIRDWDGDGILARLSDETLAQSILASGVPVVDLSGIHSKRLGVPFVGVDNEAVAKQACEHLLARGYQRVVIANWRRGHHPHLDERRDYMKAQVEAAGASCLDLELAPLGRDSCGWDIQQEAAVQKLRDLSLPVAVFATQDDVALHVLDACRRAGLRIPEDAAVLGVDNDECICGMSFPPLSSIAVNAPLVGYRAAGLLDRLMADGSIDRQTDLIPPIGIEVRQSTDVVAVEDIDVANALRYIREQACHGIQVGDVVRQVPFSRSLLERRMKAAIGRSPKAEIHRIRLARATSLLSGTGIPLVEVARAAGFGDAKHLNHAIRQAYHCTPGQYRAGQR